VAKFIYKYESVKKVKESLEKKAQKEVASIDLKIEKVKNEILEVDEKRKQISLSGEENDIVKASELHSKIYYAKYLEEHKKSLLEKLGKLELEKKTLLDELVKKSKEHKIFKTLEEKHLQNFITEENKNDQIRMDDISVQKFVRKMK